MKSKGFCHYCADPLPRFSHGNKAICALCAALRRRTIRRAERAITIAVKNGVLKPAYARLCADCGAQAFGYDHRDYSKPLQVEPVCNGCNRRRGPAAWKQAA